MAKNTCWGIDVGQCALKAVKLRHSGGQVEAVSFDVIEHAKILSQPDADEQQLIRNALDKFLSRNDVKGDMIVVGVPGQASFSRFIKLPPVELRKVPEIVKYEARQQIPFNLDEVIWDYQTMTTSAGGPAEIEVGIFAMKRDIVQDYVNDFTQVRITPDIVQMGPVALYNYLQFDRQDGAGATLLVDVGAENTSLVIADGTRVWIRNFPLGGNNFTQALVKSFKLTFAKAENLKRHAAESKYAREVFQAMRPVFSDLLTEVQRSIGFYTSLHRESRIERVLAMGNTFRLPGLQKFLSQNLGVEVTRIARFNSLQGDQVAEAPVFKENVLSFGVAYGLAIQGLGLGTVNISLLPPEILKEKELRRKRPFVVAAAAAVVVACALLAYGAHQSLGTLIDVPPELGALDKPVGGMLKAVADLEKKNQAAKGDFEQEKQKLVDEQKKIDAYLKLVDGETQYDKDAAKARYRYLWYKVLSDIWDVLPKDPRLQSLNPETDQDQWRSPPLETIELLKIVGKYDEVTEAAAAGESPLPAGPGPGGREQRGTPVLVVVIEGTIPNPGTAGPNMLDRLLRLPLVERGYNTELVGSGPYKSSTGSGYPYETEDPRIKAREEAEKAAAKAAESGGRSTGREREKEEKEKPELRRPYRGDDYWFRLQFAINLLNPAVKVEYKGPVETGTGLEGQPFESGPGPYENMEGPPNVFN